MLRRVYATQESTKNANTLFSTMAVQFFRAFRGPNFGCYGLVGAPLGAINSCSLATASRLKALLRDHVILHCCLMLRRMHPIRRKHEKSHKRLFRGMHFVRNISYYVL